MYILIIRKKTTNIRIVYLSFYSLSVLSEKYKAYIYFLNHTKTIL